MPKVSVIIPVYNVEKYLRQCLDSVVNQTLKDIEIICVDDGSTDNSLQILKEYASMDNRIKVLEQENQGSGYARNKGLDTASGEYIMFLDPDDWFVLNACELAYNKCCFNNNDFVIFTYYKYFENDDVTKEITCRLKPFKDILDNPNINLSQVKKDTLVNCNIWVQIYKNSFLYDNNIRFPNLRCTQDLPFVVDCWLKATNISILNKSIYYYRVRGNSMTFSIKNYLDRFKARELAFDNVIKSDNVNVKNAYYIHYIRSVKYWFYTIPYSQILLKIKYYNKMKEIYLMLKNNYYNDFIEEYIDYKFFDKVCKNNFFSFLMCYIIMPYVFSIRNTKNKNHKIITIFGYEINANDIKIFIQNIFSLKNVKRKDGKKHKVLTILGIKLKFRIK